MVAIDIMKELINEKSIVKLKENNGKFSGILEEPNSDYSFEISGLPKGVLIIKCDDFPDTTQFFKNSKKECKRADYVVLSSSDSRMFIIELKRSKDSSNNADTTAQLKGAGCIMKFCETIAEIFWNEKAIFGDYQQHYFKYYANPRKRPFCQKQNSSNNLPENARIIDGKKIQYNRLLQYKMV